jgi:predicted Rdx family selenoprotein
MTALAADGSIKWIFTNQHPYELRSYWATYELAVYEAGHVYMASNGWLFKLDANGQMIWERKVEDSVFAPLPGSDEKLYCNAIHTHPINAWQAQRQCWHTAYPDKHFIVELAPDGKELARWRLPLEGLVHAGPGPDGEFYAAIWEYDRRTDTRTDLLARIELPE